MPKEKREAFITALKTKLKQSKRVKGKDKFDKPSKGDKIILALLRAKKKVGKSFGSRTRTISKGLQMAGIDQKKIDRMKGKRK